MTTEEASKNRDKLIPDFEQPEGSSSDTSSTIKTAMMVNRIIETVKWFNVKHGYGFIIRSDTHENIFVHRASISCPKHWRNRQRLVEGETASFTVTFTDKFASAADVTLIDGERDKTTCTKAAHNWRHCRCPGQSHVNGKGHKLG